MPLKMRGLQKMIRHAKQMENDAAATYKNTQAQKTLQSEQKKGASQADSIAQKLANLKQQSELAADSTSKLSRTSDPECSAVTW